MDNAEKQMEDLQKGLDGQDKPSTPSANPNQRPWQGTLLGVLQAIGAVLFGLGGLAFFIMFDKMGSLFTEQEMEGMSEAGSSAVSFLVGSMGSIFGLVFLVMAALMAVFAAGYFKGWKWAVVITMVLTGLSLLSALYNVDISSVIVNGLIGWAEYICFMHPFYNKK